MFFVYLTYVPLILFNVYLYSQAQPGSQVQGEFFHLAMLWAIMLKFDQLRHEVKTIKGIP